MYNDIDVKRGTTPTLHITILMPFENIKHIDFVFKKEISDKFPELLKLSFDFPNDDSLVSKKDGSFTINAKLEDEETRDLTKGEVYMDTRIVLSNGFIPKSKIVKVRVGETLFSEVYAGG